MALDPLYYRFSTCRKCKKDTHCERDTIDIHIRPFTQGYNYTKQSKFYHFVVCEKCYKEFFFPHQPIEELKKEEDKYNKRMEEMEEEES